VKSTLRTWVSLLKNPSGLGIDLPTESATDGTPAKTYDEAAATKTMIARTQTRMALKPKHLVADTAYGTGKFLGWLIGTGVTPLWDMSQRGDGTFARTSHSTRNATSTSAPQASC
jgi:hypothetical protein